MLAPSVFSSNPLLLAARVPQEQKQRPVLLQLNVEQSLDQ